MHFSLVTGARLKAVVALIVAGFLAGCTTAAQRQYQAISTNTQDAAAKLMACGIEVYNSPEYAPLRRHVPLRTTDFTLEQLSDPAKATSEEIAIIKATHPRLQQCGQSALEQIAQTTPTIVPIALALIDKSENSLVDLLQRKQSWGDHVRRVKTAYTEASEQYTQESQRIVSGLERSHEAELARRQAALNALAQWAQTQQVINAMNRPIVTNCAGMGSMVNCVSR